MDEHLEFHTHHLPHLVNYVVAVLQKKDDGSIEVGSGVLVRVGDRHLVATAKHCIEGTVRVLRSDNPLRRELVGVSGTRELRVLRHEGHESLDLGFLEITDPGSAELGWGQLSDSPSVPGMAQFVGNPLELVERIEAVPGRLTDISLCTGTFGTYLVGQTEDCMLFDYPEVGSKFDPQTGGWMPSQFPKTPKGFSGGACFGVSKAPGVIERVEYKLLGIQYAWSKADRVVKVVPIKRWCELATRHGYRDSAA